MESVDEDTHDDTLEPRDWRSHPGAKLGAWTLELPLSELLGANAGNDDDAAEVVQGWLAALRAKLSDR